MLCGIRKFVSLITHATVAVTQPFPYILLKIIRTTEIKNTARHGYQEHTNHRVVCHEGFTVAKNFCSADTGNSFPVSMIHVYFLFNHNRPIRCRLLDKPTIQDPVLVVTTEMKAFFKAYLQFVLSIIVLVYRNAIMDI